MTEPRAQSIYQVRLGWGSSGLTSLAPSEIVVIVDALDGADAAEAPGAAELAAQAAALPHTPTVLRASLRNAAATAAAIRDEQVARDQRLAINLVLVGDGGQFAVEDFLAAGAVGDALSQLGIDHTVPDLAVATEGFRPLTRALKHLLSASSAGIALSQADRRDEVKAAAELNADTEAIRFAG